MVITFNVNDDGKASSPKTKNGVPVLNRTASVPNNKIQSIVHQNNFLRKKLTDMNEENELLKRRNNFIMNANENYYRNLRQLKISNKVASVINKAFIGYSCNGNMNVLQTFYKLTIPLIKKYLANANDNYKRIGRAIKRLSGNALNYKNGMKMGAKGYVNLASGKLKYKGLYGLDLVNALIKKINN